MINEHIHILHLNNTGDPKTDKVCNERYGNLLEELIKQNITHYTIFDGYYDPKNTKKAIQKGFKRIIQYAKDAGLKYCITAEDDLCFTSPNAYNYFISQIPGDFDLFCGVIYNGDVRDGRIMNGMSGTHTLLCTSESMYDFILGQPDDVHCDRHLGQFAYMFKYYVIDKFVCIQRGGYSHNLRRSMTYEAYLEGKNMYAG